MYNFENEVGNINNPYLRQFIENDYFHDGAIHGIEFIEEEELQLVQLVVSCEREWVADYNLDNGYSPDSNGIEERFNEKYLYKLKFLDCKFIETNVSDYGMEYINARFKDSAKLRQIITSENRNYYHLRIQLSGGYLDIIFADFMVEKVIGNVMIPNHVMDNVPFYNAIKKYKNVRLEEVRQISLNGDWLDRSLAIQYLCVMNDSLVLNSAEHALNHEDDEVQLSAIYAFGKFGNTSVIPLLFQKWLESDVDLFKKHIMDNIEKIYYRTNSPK